jgi:uncharacterized protein (TIGR00255 family)
VLLSMTGQGQGRRPYAAAEVNAEVRAVNNRHLKVQIRTCDTLSGLEPQIETLVRKTLRRGSLQLSVQLSGSAFDNRFQLQESVVTGYIQQCQALASKLGVDDQVSLRDILALPGVVSDRKTVGSGEPLSADLVAEVMATITQSLECLNGMRRAEGASMGEELTRQLSRLAELTAEIEQRAPLVVDEYRLRLEARLSKVLAELGAKLQEADLAREVLIMADKADIREEIVRLRSHFAQFEKLLSADESQGRKLDFLIQELFREANTIGSKCGDAEIAQRVVDIKTIIEQMRELVQNVE